MAIDLRHNPNFPEGVLILSKDLYKKFMGDLEFHPNHIVFLNNNLKPGTGIASTNIFKELTEGVNNG